MSETSETLIKSLVTQSKVIAVVGISEKPERASHGVAKYLQRYFRVIPVNPRLKEWEGETCYPSLASIPQDISIDIVDVFRRSEEVLPVVVEAIQRKVGSVWLQLGISNEQAAQSCSKAHIPIVMDACLAVEHARFRSRE